MKNKSIWQKNIKINELPPLTQNMEVDCLIIGGGITGISTLLSLKKTNLKTILVEQNICGMGVTSKSTAKITYLQQDIYQKICKYVNNQSANLYLESQIEATNLLTSIIQKEKIDCNLKASPSYLFINNEKNLAKLNNIYSFLKNNKINVSKVKSIPFNEPIIEAIKVNNTYTFNPLKYLNHLKMKFQDSIYEHTKVLNIKKQDNKYICQVNAYQITAQKVIIATHYPYFLLPFFMPTKCHIETSYIGTKPINTKIDFNAINLDNPCISLRTYQNNLIYLYQSLNSSNIKNIKNYFHNLKEKNLENFWSNKDIITNDSLPFIGSLIKNDNSLLIATGYNTWGMTNATLAGKILTDIILNQENSYIKLFNPRRSLNLGSIINFPLDIYSSLKAIIKGNRFNVNNSNVTYTKINNQNVAIYKDKYGKEHIVLNRCPHMKCGLILNEEEQTWDCQCHGSRFDLDGNLIEGPSNYNIKFKKES